MSTFAVFDADQATAGWRDELGMDGGLIYFHPLPAIRTHPRILQRIGSIEGAEWGARSPYLRAWVAPSGNGGVARVDLFAANGWRAHPDGMKYADAHQGDYLYADDDRVPEQWQRPIRDALRAVQKEHPGMLFRFRLDTDAVEWVDPGEWI